MSDDPLEPSAEWQARLDQMLAATRQMSDMLRAVVEQLTAEGWTEQQARQIVVSMMIGGRP